MPELPVLPPIAAAPLSVVLLARDDVAHLEAVVVGWITHLNGLKREYELLLVEDGSRDGSAELAAALADRHPRLRVLRHDLPQGVGAALATGLAAAKYPLVCYVRCEPRYRPSDLRKLLQEIDKVHLISGYRAGQPVPWGWRMVGMLYRGFCRVVFSYAPPPLPGWLGTSRHFGQLLTRIFFGVRSHDVGCPYRLLRREILARIPLQSRGSFAHVELLAKANFLGHLFSEEAPLGDRRHPVVPEECRHESLWHIVVDASRLFNHPDFGPPQLTEPEVPAAKAVALDSSKIVTEEIPSS